MAQSSLAVGAESATTGSATTVVDSPEAVQALLDVLQDPACRDILDATSHEARTANELSEACDVPQSTAYRKLDELTEAGLLAERTRIRRSGKHTSEYARLVEDVVVSIGDDGATELTVARRDGRTHLAHH